VIPEPWTFALLALAAFRIWKLIADDRILDRPRDWVLGHIDVKRGGTYWSDFLTCPWCAGFWIVLAWTVAWWIEADTLVVAVPFAISAVVGLLGTAYYAVSGE